jgi:YggT family protein
MLTLIYYLLWAYWAALLIRVLSSWIPVPPSGPLAKLMSFVYEITEPVLRPIRNLLPPIRAGAMALDLSPFIVFIVLFVLLGYLHP